MIYLIRFNNELLSVKEVCRRKNLSYKAVTAYKYKHKDLTWEEVIEIQENKHFIYYVDLDGEKVSIREYCKRKNLSYSAVTAYKYTHRDVPWEEILFCYENNKLGLHKLELDGEFITVAEYCRRKNISYSAVVRRKITYNETWEEAIDICKKRDTPKKYNKNAKDSRLLSRWHNIINRCYNPKNSMYYRYGKRGIKVCDRWQNYENFENDMLESFLEHVKGFGLHNTQIERIDYNGDYEPSNCTWATCKEQARNRSTNIVFPCGKCLMQLCEDNNLNYKLIVDRLYRGMSLLDAVTKKPKQIHKLSTGEKLVDYCRNNCIPDSGYQAILHRINKGMTVEEAIADWKKKKGR